MNATILGSGKWAVLLLLVFFIGCGNRAIMFVCPEVRDGTDLKLDTKSVCQNYRFAATRLAADQVIYNAKGNPLIIKYGESPDLYESFLMKRTNVLKSICDSEKTDVLVFAYIYPSQQFKSGYTYRLYAYLKNQGITRSLTFSSQPIHPDNFYLESFWIGNFITIFDQLGLMDDT